MPKNDIDNFTKLLDVLAKNKLVKQLVENWQEQSKKKMQTTIIIIVALLITILLLNWWGKLSIEANGWIIAALIGYLFGRSTQK